MTITAVEKLNNIFSEEFLNTHSNIDSIDLLYDEVKKIDNTISKEEFEEYITIISKQMHNNGELCEEDLESVSGGFGWGTLGTILAGVYAAAKVVSFCYDAGQRVGELIYNWRH